MLRRLHPRFCGLILLGLAWLALGSEALATTANWLQVRVGMKAAEVVQAVGEPLFKTSGKVYQTWIYDRAGEIVVADGVVVAVTPPKARTKRTADGAVTGGRKARRDDCPQPDSLRPPFPSVIPFPGKG